MNPSLALAIEKLINIYFPNNFLLFRFRFRFRRPKKSKILLFDRARSDFINSKTVLKKLEILDVRFETDSVINLPILLDTLISTGIIGLSKNYIKNYIIWTKAKIIITFTDYNSTFYILKNLLAPYKFKSIAVQSSYRSSGSFSSFKKNKYQKYLCDYFLYHDDDTKEKFVKKIIKSNFIKIGSFKSNSIRIEKNPKNKNILYISQFKNHFLQTNKSRFLREKKIIKWLLKFCENKKYNFKIAVRKNITTFNTDLSVCKKEYLKFFDFLDESYLVGVDKNNNNYNHADNALLVVFANSTLGLEAFSRGKKILAFPVLPFNVKKKEFFWNTNFNYKKFSNTAKHIINMSQNKWNKITRKSPLKLKRDNNNKIFNKIVKKYEK